MMKIVKHFLLVLLASISVEAAAQNIKGENFNSITLEASLKPFKKNSEKYIRETAREMFVQWHSLLRHTDTVSVMLWTADGSEILDYKGDLNQLLEWAMYMGNPNTQHEVGSGPEELSLHERAYLYMEDPPSFTYGDLAFIVKALKEEGRKVTGKPIRVGATFDPGPEFAKSEFKYKKHPEILGGSAMGHKSFVSAYSVLNADEDYYAGFPEGIPANTPFGTFFGRQSQHFLTDLGFDYIWLSNGFGFGVEGWSATGAIFTGSEFEQEKLASASAKVLEFWKLFRQECPDFPIQTRGTNLSVGADLARDAVDLKSIYEGDFNMLPPPNSPWAALDGDFGLEMVGYMSRMAELPDNRFPFRYYTHDPWWLNSPWLDRYGREPHDIYLPMAVARIDAEGDIGVPTHLNFLTIDDTYGDMPTQVPDEVIPHILKARYDQPTAAGPLVWIYPFDEYHEWAYKYEDRLSEIYYGDWFIRQAINSGLPLNTVISTGSFESVLKEKPEMFTESVLLTIAPEAGSSLEQSLMDFVQQGGKLIVFGPVDHSGQAFMDFLNLRNDQPLEGEFKIISEYKGDSLVEGYPQIIRHQPLFSGGGFRTLINNPSDRHTHKLIQVEQAGTTRDMAWMRALPDWKEGKLVYVRGTNSSSFTGGRLLTPDNPQEYFIAPSMLRHLLNEFGMDLQVQKKNPSVKDPMLTIARADNAFVFSGYNPNTTVKQRFKFDQGAPLLLGYQTELETGYSTYHMPTAWHRESRVFLVQDEGIVSYRELHSGQKGITKRFEVTGLQDATVLIYPPEDVEEEGFNAYNNARYPWKNGHISFASGDPKHGKHFIIKNITGSLVVSW